MNVGIIVLFSTDAVLTIAGIWVVARKGPHTQGAMHGPEALLLLVGALAIHAFAILACGIITQRIDGVWSASEQLTLVMASLAGGAVPMLLLGYLVAAGFASSITMFMSGERPPSPVPVGCAEAERIALSGDIDGAVKAYKWFYREYPQSTKPLFEAAVLLARHERPHEAADMLREIMRLNRDNTVEWLPSAQLLANILRNHLDEPESADYLIAEIAKRGTVPAPVAETAKTISRPEAAAKMDRARTLASRGNVDGAVRLFKEIDRADAASPHALKAAAVALEADGRMDEAYRVYREIMRRFSNDLPVWSLAAHRAALICINHLQSPDEARTVARMLLQKSPGSAAGRWAGAYLMDVNRETL
ncbi:MAG: tetratricopeptide repeat protein [Candidatus Hydrogenedentales bacterium]|jgi:tetratricopeptide (TPR) repeat protein